MSYSKNMCIFAAIFISDRKYTMENKRLKPNFMFSFAELESLGGTAVSLAQRDHEELVSYGVDEVFVSNLEEKTEQLRNFATDPELLGAEVDCNETKVAYFDDTKIAIRTMMVKVKQVLKEESPMWILFGTKGLNEMNELQLIKCGFRVVRRATQFLEQLLPKGVTQEMIDELELTVKNFDEAYDKQQDAKYERKSTTVQRLMLANDLYALITELFNYGKDYWYTRNEAKYKAYIIYNTPSGKKPKAAAKGEVVSKKKKGKV